MEKRGREKVVIILHFYCSIGLVREGEEGIVAGKGLATEKERRTKEKEKKIITYHGSITASRVAKQKETKRVRSDISKKGEE